MARTSPQSGQEKGARGVCGAQEKTEYIVKRLRDLVYDRGWRGAVPPLSFFVRARMTMRAPNFPGVSSTRLGQSPRLAQSFSKLENKLDNAGELGYNGGRV